MLHPQTPHDLGSLRSLRDSLARSPKKTKKLLASLKPEECEELLHWWELWARPEQLAPAGEWRTWLIQAGRGWGKTRSGAEWVNGRARLGKRRIHLVGRTAADVRDVMIEGESGILACSPTSFRPLYQPSKRRLTWPNGAIATTFSADEPDQLRGPQCTDAWADELAAWQYDDAWDQLQFGLRLGDDPRCAVTTTPRPTKIVRDLIADENTRVTRGRTKDNRANLAPAFLEKILKKYEGTRLGEQELEGRVLADTPGALWTNALLEGLRVRVAPTLIRIVVAVDPATTAKKGSDETGIIVIGLGVDGHLYVLEDGSGIYKPHEWASKVLALLDTWEADLIIGESNNGGDLVESNITTMRPNAPVKLVWASRGKRVRAEPVSTRYEKGEVHHVGSLPKLEDEQTTWDSTNPDAPSPGRVDALVWGATELSEVLPAASPAKTRTKPEPSRWGDSSRGF